MTRRYGDRPAATAHREAVDVGCLSRRAAPRVWLGSEFFDGETWVGGTDLEEVLAALRAARQPTVSA